MADGGAPASDAVASITGRVASRAPELAERFATAYAADIADYATTPAEDRHEFVRSARANLDALIADLSGRTVEFDAAPFESFGADRMRMGIPIGAVMRSFTVWGQQAWSAFRECVDTSDPDEATASLAIGERIFAHVERASAATAAGFMSAAMEVWSDREITRNALLEALLTGHVDEAELGRSELVADERYAVLVLCPRDTASRVERMVVGTADRVRALGLLGSAIGCRDGNLVVVCPVGRTPDAVLDERIARLGDESGTAIGLGRSDDGVAGIPRAYAEARDAARIAHRCEISTPVGCDDVLLERLVASSELTGTVLARTFEALAAYDARRATGLVDTADAFVESRGSITDAARAVHVHPNTVVYRLGRIAAVTGVDPRTVRGLALFTVARIVRRLWPGDGPADR